MADADIPTQAATCEAWENRVRSSQVYAKCIKCHAMQTTTAGQLDTIVNGVKETTKSYEVGDWIVMGPSGERYSMDNKGFTKRYIVDTPNEAQTPELAAEGFKLYTACGRIWARQISEAECAEYFPSGQFLAAWGEAMAVNPGDYLAVPNPQGGEIYRIETSAFMKTYAPTGLPPLYPS